MSLPSTWSIEYSHSEETFHLGRTTEMFRRNIYSVHSGKKSDYICVGIFATKEQAMDAMLEFRRNRMPDLTISLVF
jgi:hypothetical protein